MTLVRETVAITGVTGFVGGALARRLAERGYEIRGVTRPQSHHTVAAGVVADWRLADITQPDSLFGVFDGADWLVHAAGMLGQAGVTGATYRRLHVEGTRNVLAEARRSGLKRVLYVSSPGVLGPIDEEPADENAPYAPSNPYERSKAEAEQVAREVGEGGLPIIIARPEFIYGPGDRHVLGLFRAIRRGLFFYIAGGRHVCHPTYIDDAVDGLTLALERGRPGQIYHLAGPEPVTFRQLAETIATALDTRRPWLSLPRLPAWLLAVGLEGVYQLVAGQPPLSRTAVAFFSEDRRFSWQKACNELGYIPQVPLDEGIARTVAWYRKQGWL